VLIDTHNHLYWKDFDSDRDAVIARMSEAGVHGAVVIGTDEETWAASQALARQYPQLRYAVGLHPTSVFPLEGESMALYLEDELSILFEATPAPVAIGECGIDLHWKENDPQVTWAVNPLSVQQHVFLYQLELAARLDQAVIVHTRDANAETLECLEAVPETRGVLHCFNGSAELLAFALAQPGWYVSFAGNVTYPKAQELHAAAQSIPLEKLLVETDAPFMPPVPHRGQRNEPAYVRQTAEFIAQLRGITLQELAAQTTRNAEALFRTSFRAELN
jgi:TatD DNase family protein